MSITSENAYIIHDGDGSTQYFSLTTKAYSTSEIEAYIIDADGVATLHAGSKFVYDSSVQIEVTPAPAVGEKVYIGKVMTLTQEETLDYGTFDESTIETMFDKAANRLHQLKDLGDRALKFKKWSTNRNPTVDDPIEGNFLVWDANGDLVNSTGSSQVANLDNLSNIESLPTALTNLGLNNVDNTSDVDKPISTAGLAGDAASVATAAAALSVHESDTETHGATGAVVGTTNTQTLENKFLTNPIINTAARFASTAPARFYESGGTGGDYIGLKAPSSLAGSLDYTLPVDGTTGQFMKTDGSGLLSFDDPTIPPLNVVTKTATATLLIAENFVIADASAGDFTLTLPTSVGNSGKPITIIKPDSDTTNNVVTIDGNGSETIGGALTKKLARTGGFIKIVPDGSNWIIADKNLGTNLITLTTDMGSWTTNTTWTTKYRVSSDETTVDLWYLIETTAAPNSVTLYFDLPSDLTLKTADMVDTSTLFKARLGDHNMRDDSASYQYGVAGVYYAAGVASGNNDVFYPLFQSSTGREYTIDHDSPHTWVGSDFLSATLFNVPISGY